MLAEDIALVEVERAPGALAGEVERALGAPAEDKLGLSALLAHSPKIVLEMKLSAHLSRFLTVTLWCPPQHSTHQPPTQADSRPRLS